MEGLLSTGPISSSLAKLQTLIEYAESYWLCHLKSILKKSDIVVPLDKKTIKYKRCKNNKTIKPLKTTKIYYTLKDIIN